MENTETPTVLGNSVCHASRMRWRALSTSLHVRGSSTVSRVNLLLLSAILICGGGALWFS